MKWVGRILTSMGTLLSQNAMRHLKQDWSQSPKQQYKTVARGHGKYAPQIHGRGLCGLWAFWQLEQRGKDDPQCEDE